MAITPTKDLLPGIGVAYNGGRADYVVPLVDDGTGTLVPQTKPAGLLTDRSGTITTGNTAQQLAAANTGRRYLCIQNLSAGDLAVNFGADATLGGGSYLLKAASGDGEADGGVLTFEGSFIPSQAVSIIGATTGQAFTAKEG